MHKPLDKHASVSGAGVQARRDFVGFFFQPPCPGSHVFLDVHIKIGRGFHKQSLSEFAGACFFFSLL